MFNQVKRSLEDIAGEAYVKALSKTAGLLHDFPEEEYLESARERIDFLPDKYIKKVEDLTENVGKQVVAPFLNENFGAATDGYNKATALCAAPIGGVGCIRVGEDGRIYLASKSEHYQISLGHNFPGYKLIDIARKLHIPNATHNNTRGYITRLMERKLIADIYDTDDDTLNTILASREPKVLNRVISLQTGSLAVEAGIKMMLTNFYRLDNTFSQPKHFGKIPVFFVMSDNEGGLQANYHGTTVIAQTLRGMWPGYYKKLDEAGIYKVVSVKINDIDDFKEKMSRYNDGKYKTAGFLHEIILMNYGGIRLTEEYLDEAYRVCREYNTPTLVDEIQSCMWYKGIYLFKQYRLKPDFVVVGKGFPGGEYSASKIITTYEMDTLSQFGALVTNGQEELASLAYLITMDFVRENGEEIERLGAYLENELEAVKNKYPSLIIKIEGQAHCFAIHFDSADTAVSFTKILNSRCVDVSTQTYKADCPPAALFKLPLIMTESIIKFLCGEMCEALNIMSNGEKING